MSITAPIDQAFELLRAHALDLAIQIAQYRDGQLTEAESIAMLDVYQEFGQ